MPFASSHYPSIQLGLLAALGRARGFHVDTFHLNLDLAVALGPDLYDPLSFQYEGHRGCQIGDWLFSREAFGSDAPDPDDRFLNDFAAKLAPILQEMRIDAERLRELRRRDLPAYLDRLERELPWHRYEVVGFTSTFQQSAAAIALARRIKARHPGVVTLFGGANFEDEMGRELVRTVPAIDYAVDGEADVAFPAFLEALAAGRDPAEVPGILVRRGAEVRAAPRPATFARLDESPFPDYDEYFERAERLGLLDGARRRDLWLPVEGSRGCWWGRVQHCTFCGLNGTTMAYRSKSPDRLLEELAYLAGRHRVFQFQAVDNIASPENHRELFPRLAKEGLDYRFFWEVKSNLRREQVRQLKRAGVDQMQPGIESLSSHVLELMHKGVRAIDNVNLLRWARYYGIDTSWAILWGFPGETEADYLAQAELIPHLLHLQPPSVAGRLWLERFSPLYADRASWTASVRPEASYGYVYPPGVDLERVAYFFDFEAQHTPPATAYHELAEQVAAWEAAWRAPPRPALRYRASPDLVEVDDARQPDKPLVYHLEGPLADLYTACAERPRRAKALRSELELPWPEEEIAAALDLFCAKGLMMRDADRFLALALPATPNR